jgi:hypothetical protein
MGLVLHTISILLDEQNDEPYTNKNANQINGMNELVEHTWFVWSDAGMMTWIVQKLCWVLQRSEDEPTSIYLSV